MAARKRLSRDARRKLIVSAAIPLFAKKGFRGTTTKELAAAAGVSEALLYKHFPSKDSMYEEIQKVCFQKRQEYVDLLGDLEPSTENLVFCVWFLLERTLCRGMVRDKVIREALPRLVLTSLLEDGNFARIVLVDNSAHWREPMYACLAAARDEGTVTNVPEGEDELVTWFVHHIAFTGLLMDLPKKSVIDYGRTPEELRDRVANFLLVGMGMKPSLIKKLYKPDKFLKSTDA